MKDKLKAKRERRGELLEKMQTLFGKAEAEKRDFSAEEMTEYNSWETELAKIDEELPVLEQMEARQAEIAKQTAANRKKANAITGGEQRSDDSEENPHIEVTNSHLKTKEARNVATFKLIKGKMGANDYAVSEARKMLAEGGHYDDLIIGPNGEKRSFDTLVDENGGVLLPTTVTADIMNMMRQYGVIAATSLNLGTIQNPTKIPEVLSKAVFYAVAQGGTIQGTGFNLGGIMINPEKWGCIIPWTNEVDETVAATLMPIIMDQTAEGYAKAIDDSGLKGNGTSSYNSIKGLEGLAGNVPYVRVSTAASGHTAFATVDADDYINATLNVSPSARSGAMWVMHPNMIVNLKKLKDGDGRYIYASPSASGEPATLWGYPIRFTEAASFTDGVSKVYAYFYNPRYMAYASGRALSADRLREGIIANSAGTDINLAKTDQQALRFTGKFDIKLSQVTSAVESTSYGAFTVLKTAAS